MKVIINNAALKLVAVGSTKILCTKLPIIMGQNKEKQIGPLPLGGLGHTSNGEGAIPWLVTNSSTRASYIILAGEALSSSYIYEKLHVYDWALATEIANAITSILKPVTPSNKEVLRPSQ